MQLTLLFFLWLLAIQVGPPRTQPSVVMHSIVPNLVTPHLNQNAADGIVLHRL